MLRARRIGAAVEAVDAGAIPADMTFRQWCQHLADAGLKIDRKPFRLDDRPALLAIYDSIPTTREEAAGWTLVMQKATQLGLTVWETLADIYMAKKWGPVNIGLFLPDQATASFKSHHRFMPIVRSAPVLYRELMTRPPGEGKGGTEGSVMTRQFGRSLLMFLWTSGKVSTESRPMDVVSMDEVQGMTLEQIDKCRARMGDSPVRFTLLLSTANDPERDINAWYLRGTQEVWRTRCPHCEALSDLSDPTNGVFPDRSIGYSDGTNHRPLRCDDGARVEVINAELVGAGSAPYRWDGALLYPPEGEHVWTCPECGNWIADAQAGAYVATNPAAGAARVRSFLLPRTISPKITPREMLNDWRHAKTGDQKKSFFNRTLARPFVDHDKLPVTLEMCEAAVHEGRMVKLEWETEAEPGASYYMGIDQMGGWCAIIIKKRLPDGRQGVVHVEAAYGVEPFLRASELMKAFRVSVCVVEQLPNVNSARAFAQRHPRRVFLNTAFGDDMLVWYDQLDRSDRRTAEADRSQWELKINQYKLMQLALFRVRDLQCLFPDPDLLVQEVQTEKGAKTIPILRDWVFDHFSKTGLVVEQDEKTRKPRAFVQKLGLDPHFSFANMLCDAAWAREQGSGTIFIPQNGAPLEAVVQATVVPAAAPGAPATTAPVVVRPASNTCGSCEAFHAKRGWCNARKMLTGPREHACLHYLPLDDD
jgi:hypothetical protein